MSNGNRKQQILKVIIDDYISTAEPVGSQSLVQRYPLQVSAATVRNVMSELEGDGYLEQPHPSAGRVPSDRGYRKYVDELIQTTQPPAVWREEIAAKLNQSLERNHGLLQRAAEVLTEATGYPTLCISPQMAQSELVQMKMLMIEPGRVLVVLVLRPGVVRDAVIRVPSTLNQQTLDLLSQTMQQHLSGKRIDEITWITVETAAQGIELPDVLLNQVLFEAYLAIKQAENLDSYVEGLTQLLTYPEFRDVRKTKDLLDLLLRDGLLAGYLNEEADRLPATIGESPSGTEAGEGSAAPVAPVGRDAFLIRIGQEIRLPGLHDCSFVTTAYRIGDRLAGRIGIIGPKRMPYSEVIAQVAYVRQLIQSKYRSDEREERG